jgi:signal transduction histidine kinase
MEVLNLTPQEAKARLLAHRELHELPEPELDWIIAHAQAVALPVGSDSFPRGSEIEELLILLEGQVTIYVDRGAGSRRTMDWRAGDVLGMLPFSRMKQSPGTPVVEERVEALAVNRRHFPELIRECPALIARLVHLMLDRARVFTQQDLHDEKMLSLGRLSAGLAHELDNPASAVMRGAKRLSSLLGDLESASVILGQARVPAAQLEAVREFGKRCVSVRAQHIRSPLEQARHEEEIADWLEEHGARIANPEALAETTITVEMLDELAGRVEPGVLAAALDWVAAGCAARTIVAETGEAASRMSELVKAVRAFTHRDEAGAPRPVDVQQSLAETLAVLRAKAKEKSVRVRILADPDLPRVESVGGELNQIWSNLIDNALDAVAEGGAVDVVAKRAGSSVQVSIIDDGPGIPPEHRDRIFDPFFTTKPVGQGTGQGLDIVRRLVARRRGQIEVFGAPGRTEFRVTLGIAPETDGRPEPAGGRGKGAAAS